MSEVSGTGVVEGTVGLNVEVRAMKCYSKKGGTKLINVRAFHRFTLSESLFYPWSTITVSYHYDFFPFRWLTSQYSL